MSDEKPTCPASMNTSQQECPYAEATAKAAVKEVFAILGVDIDKPESVESFREDLRFGRKLRRASDHGFLALIGLLVAGVSVIAWSGLVTAIKGH